MLSVKAPFKNTYPLSAMLTTGSLTVTLNVFVNLVPSTKVVFTSTFTVPDKSFASNSTLFGATSPDVAVKIFALNDVTVTFASLTSFPALSLTVKPNLSPWSTDVSSRATTTPSSTVQVNLALESALSLIPVAVTVYSWLRTKSEFTVNVATFPLTLASVTTLSPSTSKFEKSTSVGNALLNVTLTCLALIAQS